MNPNQTNASKSDPHLTPLDPSDEGDSKDRKTHLRETERQLRERNQQKKRERNPSIQRTIAHYYLFLISFSLDPSSLSLSSLIPFSLLLSLSLSPFFLGGEGKGNFIMAASSSVASSSNFSPQFRSRFGDTSQTKIFVGGLPWETSSEELHAFFTQFGEILEAVVITDRITGRSKGYGFVSIFLFFYFCYGTMIVLKMSPCFCFC